MQTAVIYARYSSYGQTEQSIEGQVRECTEYASFAFGKVGKLNFTVSLGEQLHCVLHNFTFATAKTSLTEKIADTYRTAAFDAFSSK